MTAFGLLNCHMKKKIVLLRAPALFVSCQYHLLSTDCLTGELRITFTLKAFLF